MEVYRMNSVFLIIFSLFTFSASVLYLYLFSRKQEKFMRYWGFSWIAYSFSLLFLLLFLNTGYDIFMELRKITDMFNLLLLLFGSYSFVHIRIPTYWYRFSLYMLLLALICIIYDFDLLSFYLPISTYQLIVTVFICYNIWKYWNIVMKERIAATVVFFTWGAIKSILSIVEIFSDMSDLYTVELLMSNLLNFCILIIYIMYTQKEGGIASDLYNDLIENSKDVVFFYKVRPYRAFDYISPSVETITGFPQASFYDDPDMFMKLTDDRSRDNMEVIFYGKAPEDESFVFEMTRANDEKFWGEFSFTLINGDDGMPDAVEGTFRDITKIKTAQLEHINATRSRNTLLSYISHELRTPITSIAGFLTALSDGTMNSEEEKQEAMDIITSKTMTLKKLVDDLDQLTKLETHQFDFDFMAYTAGDITEMLINSHSSDIRNSGFDLSIDCDLRDLHRYWIIADRGRIAQVFSNLVTNAMKYSGEKKEISFHFSIDEPKDNFVAAVSDSGIGIKENQLAHIFDRFYRADTENSRKVEGRGLGLTLCKEIINAHQGDIFAESTYGHGSTFTFIIPLYKEA